MKATRDIFLNEIMLSICSSMLGLLLLSYLSIISH